MTYPLCFATWPPHPHPEQGNIQGVRGVVWLEGPQGCPPICPD